MNKKELVELLIENFGNEYGLVDLRGLDFGDKIVFLTGMKAKEIYQNRLTAEVIFQNSHTATEIYQCYHTATEIYQFGNRAKKIIQNND